MVSLGVVVLTLMGAQAGGLNPKAAAMAKLEAVVGDWKGTGWQMDGERKVPFGSHETVVKQAGGSLFSITGKHWVEGKPEEVLYDAFGTITFDPASKGYTLTNHFSNGATQVFPLTLVKDGFTWKMGSVIEMELLIVDGVWVEKGFRVSGETKTQIFEITMRRAED